MITESNPDSLHIFAMLKNGHRYILAFDDRNIRKALRQLGRMACDPELEFSWYDAAVMVQQIKIRFQQDFDL